MFMDWTCSTDLIIIIKKQIFREERCFGKIGIFLSIEFCGFFSHPGLHPCPSYSHQAFGTSNHPFKVHLHLASRSPHFPGSPLLHGSFCLLFHCLLLLFFQTAVCFKCHRASIFGHFLSFVLVSWVVIHGWGLQKSVRLVWLLLWTLDCIFKNLLSIYPWMLHSLWPKHTFRVPPPPNSPLSCDSPCPLPAPSFIQFLRLQLENHRYVFLPPHSASQLSTSSTNNIFKNATPVNPFFTTSTAAKVTEPPSSLVWKTKKWIDGTMGQMGAWG